MKKRFGALVLALVLAFALGITVCAVQPRTSQTTPSLSATGATTNCVATVRADKAADKILLRPYATILYLAVLCWLPGPKAVPRCNAQQ